MEGGAKIRVEIEFVGRDAPPLHSRIPTFKNDFNREVTHYCGRLFKLNIQVWTPNQELKMRIIITSFFMKK